LQAAITAKKAAAQKAPPKPTVSEILASQDVETDADLQEALLRSNPDLSNTFREAVINGSVTPAQFWSSRTHLLRAFLVERSQQKGPYNVLATIRPKTVDNKITVNMTREKIKDVFAQHPLLRRIYDETVPPLGEDEFWSRFFVSRLCKKLRGERILPSDPVDDKLDGYINIEAEESRKRAREEEEEYVPKVINIEGNEAHNSKKMGNAPDFTMRPSRTDVIHSINSISLRMLDSLAPKDGEGAGARSARQERYEQDYYAQEIQLGDLTITAEDAKIMLNIRDQSDFFKSHETSVAAAVQRDPAEVIASTRRAIAPDFELSTLFAKTEDHDDAIEKTGGRINAAIVAHRPRTGALDGETLLGAATHAQLQMSHSATQEFLSLFWQHFLSGDAAKAKQLAKMADALKRTHERVEAIRARAESTTEGARVETVWASTKVAVDRALNEYVRAVKQAGG
ncbi:MAG: hypothetical protein EOO77_24790, partial [Oxalobacteraceae bacterium]